MRRALLAALAAAAMAFAIPGVSADAANDVAKVAPRVRNIVQMHLGIPVKGFDDQKRLTQYGMDELDLVELIMALEEEFGIEIPDAAIDTNGPRGWDDAVTTQRLVEIVMDRLRKKQKG